MLGAGSGRQQALRAAKATSTSDGSTYYNPIVNTTKSFQPPVVTHIVHLSRHTARPYTSTPSDGSDGKGVWVHETTHSPTMANQSTDAGLAAPRMGTADASTDYFLNTANCVSEVH